MHQAHIFICYKLLQSIGHYNCVTEDDDIDDKNNDLHDYENDSANEN